MSLPSRIWRPPTDWKDNLKPLWAGWSDAPLSNHGMALPFFVPLSSRIASDRRRDECRSLSPLSDLESGLKRSQLTASQSARQIIRGDQD